MSNHLYEALLGTRSFDDHPFLRLPDGAVLTYGELFALSGQLAHVLTNMGAEFGDRIAVQVEKSPNALALYLACVRSGLVYLPLNPAYTLAEVEQVVGDAEPAVFVCDPDRRHELTAAAQIWSQAGRIGWQYSWRAYAACA